MDDTSAPSAPLGSATMPLKRRDDAPAELLARGSLVDRYLVFGVVGEGGMSTVYRAYDPSLHREVALKVLKPGAADDPTRLLREAQSMARLSHPNVLPVYDVGTVARGGAQVVYLAMEYVEGEDLRAWARAQGSSWRSVRSAFVAAGEGLGAAHRAGIVHRDFKPSNVLVGPGSRVRVLDFGLARGDQSLPSTGGEGLAFGSTAESQDAVSAEITRAGAILGTPAYMPPEQHRGDKVDQRADQYAFCVALFEALYGRRPFGGGGAELLERKLAAELPGSPPRRGVPKRVHQAIVRGLSPEAADRWPTMAELLAELRRDPRDRRLIVAGFGVLGLAATAGYVASTAQETTTDPCEELAASMAAVWDESRSERLLAAFERHPAGAQAWAQFGPKVEGYVEGWQAVRASVCEGELDAMTRERQHECLSDRLRDLDALLTVYESPDEQAIRRAPRAIRSLRDVEICGDASALATGVDQPADADEAAAVAELRGRLSRARALETAGRYAEGDALASEVLAAARSVGYRPVEAEVLRRLGNLAMQRSKYDDATPLLEDAYFVGAASGHVHVAYESAIDLMFLMSTHGQPAAALAWSRHAEMIHAAAGYPEEHKARLHDRLGLVYDAMGDVEASYEHHRRAVELRRGDGSKPIDVSDAQAIMHLAIAQRQLGKLDESAKNYRQVLDVFRRELGPRHPDIAIVLINQSSLLKEQGDLDAAQVAAETALSIIEEKLGPEHYYAGATLINLVAVHEQREEYDVALEKARRALGITEASLGVGHPGTANAHQTVGTIALRTGDVALARVEFERAIEALGQGDGSDVETLAGALVGLGEALTKGPQPEAARPVLERVKTLVPDGHPARDEAVTLLAALKTRPARPVERSSPTK